MVDQLNSIGETGFKFFGKMTASISHEIKNVLAIINENAGLLDDFSAMADQGMAIDPARLKKMAGALANQVGRADGILKNMDQFAHSIDKTIIDVDLNEIIKLLIALADRFAAMRSVAVETDLSENLIKIRTSPFLLMNLLWLCLDFAMDACGAGHTVVVQTLKAGPGVQIILLSGNVSGQLAVKAKTLGVLEIFEKPVDIEVLMRKIKNARS